MQPLPERVSMVAFANDVALVLVAKDIQDLEYYVDKSIEMVAGWLSISELEYFGDEALDVVAHWLSHHDLLLAAEKTDATFTVKYLGVTIDARLSFKEHLLNTGLKASKVAGALGGLCPTSEVRSNLVGLSSPRWCVPQFFTQLQ